MNVAVIFAGGVGKRMNSKAKPKQFLEMHGKPIIIHTLEKFENHSEIDGIVVVCISEWIDYLCGLIESYNIKKVRQIVAGGTTSQLSIFEGLKAVEKMIGCDHDAVVLIHDGVRPLINAELISKNIESVKQHGSAITTTAVTETIMEVEKDGAIVHIPKRNNSRLARAPQSFWLKEIIHMHRMALEEGVTDYIDSCTMMQHYGKLMYLVDGSRDNIKVTTPEDFYIMRALLDAKENSQIYGIEE